MLRDFGATIIILVLIGLLVGGVYFVVVAPCDPATQHCLVDVRK